MSFVKENLTFTGEDSPMANLLQSVMGAFAQFERSDPRAPARRYRIREAGGEVPGPEAGADCRASCESERRRSALAREFGISRDTL